MSKKTERNTRGFVVDHKESKVRYAVLPENFNPKVHVKVRPLQQHETARSYVPKAAPKDRQTAEVQAVPDLPATLDNPQ